MISSLLRRIGWWLIKVTTPTGHCCSGQEWHSEGSVSLGPGDIHETSDEFGPTTRVEVLDIQNGAVLLNQLIRCPDIRARAMEDYLQQKFEWVAHR